MTIAEALVDERPLAGDVVAAPPRLEAPPWTRVDTAWLACLALVLCLILAGLVARQRLEKDEGYLSAASWLVSQGRLPYRDFVFPQQPYFPLLQAPVLRAVGPSLPAARVLPALAFAVLGGLLLVFVQRHDGAPSLARWAGAVFCFNTMALFWYPRCRQYAFTDLLLFGSFLLVAEAGRASSRSPAGRQWLCGLAGLAAGGALHVRLLVITAAAVLALAAARASGVGWSWRQLRAFAVGLAAASLPFAWVAAQAPREWLYQAVTLQTRLRPPFEAGAMLRRGSEVLVDFLSQPVPAALWLLAAWGALSWARGARPPHAGRRLAWQMLLVLTATALLCHPTQAQYLVQTLPYLVVVAAEPWGRLLVGVADGRRPWARLATGLLLVAVVTAGSKRAVWRIAGDAADPQLSVVDLAKYQAFMEGRTAPGQSLLTWWPGYLLVSRVVPYPGAELGQPSERGVGTMSKQEYLAHGLRHPEQTEVDVRSGKPHWVVTGQSSPSAASSWLEPRYLLRGRFGGIRVYERRPDA